MHNFPESNEPTENDFKRLQQCIDDCLSLCESDMAIARVSAGPYCRNVIVTSFAIEQSRCLESHIKHIGIKMLASALMRACADPDSYNVIPNITIDEIELDDVIYLRS